MAAPIPYVDGMKLKGKSVLLRLDLNVPLSQDDSGGWKIDDDTRIREALPTIKYCMGQGARVVICSHLGRPDGVVNKKYSLEPVAKHLAETLSVEVVLSNELTGDGVHQMIRQSRGTEIIMLENLRFTPAEEANDPAFIRGLARLCDVYITDAFGTAHRKHASTYGVPSVMMECGAGFLIQKELKYLHPLVDGPAHPFVLIAGGAKVTDKLKAIDHLLNYVDQIVIGGAMAYAFLAAQKIAIGKSKCEVEGIAAAEQILKKAKERKVEIHLPVDHLVGPKNIVVDKIGVDDIAFDIGPKTIEHFSKVIQGAKTIFWNGPMGFFEKPEYAEGTLAIAKAVVASGAVKVAGGGDTLSAVQHFELGEKFDLLSTGGGASLKYLEGKGLPGIEVLRGKQAVDLKVLDTTEDEDIL